MPNCQTTNYKIILPGGKILQLNGQACVIYGAVTLNKATLSITAFSIMTFSITTLNITALSIMTLSITKLSKIVNKM